MLPSLDLTSPVATITLRGTEVANRLGAADIAEIRQHIAKVNACDQVVVLRLRAEGRHFCSGFDLKQLAAGGGEGVSEFAAMVDAVEDARPVTIALIDGGVYGGGTDLALACDFRIGTPNTEMFMPAVRIGLMFYKRGLERFMSRLGFNNAKRLLLTGEKLEPQSMWGCGFLTHLVAAEQLEATAEQLIATLLATAPMPLLGMKRHLNSLARGSLDVDELEQDVARAGRSADLREGAAAWLGKRVPRFIGR